ncbi:MAG: EamA family transporter [Nanoarchaeota archaeon]
MQAWLLYAIIAYTFYAFANVSVKYVRTRNVKSIIGYLSSISILGLLPLLYTFIRPITFPSIQYVFLGIGASWLLLIYVVPFLKAIEFEEVSRVVPLWFFAPIVVVLLETIFGAPLAQTQLLAFFLLIIGGILISTKDLRTFTFSKALPLMILSSVLMGVYLFLIDTLYAHVSPYDGYMITRIGVGSFIVVVLLIPSLRRQLFSFFKEDPHAARFSLLTEFIALFGTMFLFFALAGGVASIVAALMGVQVGLLFLFMILFSIFFPKIMKEDLSAKTLIIKAIALAIMIYAIWIL